jgi:hypothetical protein
MGRWALGRARPRTRAPQRVWRETAMPAVFAKEEAKRELALSGWRFLCYGREASALLRL